MARPCPVLDASRPHSFFQSWVEQKQANDDIRGGIARLKHVCSLSIPITTSSTIIINIIITITITIILILILIILLLLLLLTLADNFLASDNSTWPNPEQITQKQRIFCQDLPEVEINPPRSISVSWKFRIFQFAQTHKTTLTLARFLWCFQPHYPKCSSNIYQPSSPILETIFQPHQPAPVPHVDSIAASSAFSSPHNIIFSDLLDPQQLVVAIRNAESLNLWIEGKIYRIARGFTRFTQQKHKGFPVFFHDPFLGLKQDLRTNRYQRDLT